MLKTSTQQQHKTEGFIMMNRQALKAVEPGQKVGIVLPGKQVEIMTVEKTTRTNIWLENGMVFNKKFGHRVRNTSDQNEWNAGHLVHPETAAQMLGTYHLKEKNWDPKTHNRETRRLRKAAMNKATPVEWDKKTLPKIDKPQEKPAVPPALNPRVTKLASKAVKAANEAAQKEKEKHAETLAIIKAKAKADAERKKEKVDTKRATQAVDALHKALHERQVWGSLYELNVEEFHILETLIEKLHANKIAPIEKQSVKEKKPEDSGFKAVYGKWSLQNSRKSWAIAKDDHVFRRNGYNGGAGAVITYKTQAAAEKKIKTILDGLKKEDNNA
jgi:hypothetical protein